MVISPGCCWAALYVVAQRFPEVTLDASSVVVNPLCAAHSGATHSATSVPSHCRNPFDRFMSLSS